VGATSGWWSADLEQSLGNLDETLTNILSGVYRTRLGGAGAGRRMQIYLSFRILQIPRWLAPFGKLVALENPLLAHSKSMSMKFDLGLGRDTVVKECCICGYHEIKSSDWHRRKDNYVPRTSIFL